MFQVNASAWLDIFRTLPPKFAQPAPQSILCVRHVSKLQELLLAQHAPPDTLPRDPPVSHAAASCSAASSVQATALPALSATQLCSCKSTEASAGASQAMARTRFFNALLVLRLTPYAQSAKTILVQ